FGVGLLGLSALGFFVALFAAVSQRSRELALLRALGARPALLLRLVLLEALALGLIGGLAGIALGRGAAAFAAHRSAVTGGPLLNLPAVGGTELLLLVGAAVLSVLASLAPALMAYRLSPAQALR
ncbi:MAG: ABC-type transport system permease component, partial [Phenylobacterium sp.]|nr:ABC-type transport system permease component [Phenylobacterium sp.]